MQYLESYEHYSDRYDRLVVDHCLMIEKSILENEAIPPNQRPFIFRLILYPERGELCLKKEKAIKEWMDKDAERDQHINRVQEPKNVFCKLCGRRMEMLEKILEIDWKNSKRDRVLFHFSCTECKFLKSIDEWGVVTDRILWILLNLEEMLMLKKA